MTIRLLEGDALSMLKTLPSESVQCVVTSPPYFLLRDYGVAGQIGLEPTPALFIAALMAVFDEVWRVLRADGTCWVNLGDSYAGSGKGPSGANGIGDQGQRQGFITASSQRGPAASNRSVDGEQGASSLRGFEGIKPKNLLLIPERFAIAMQEAGWIVRSRIAWCKKSAMPESVRDRPTSAWEHIWLFSKSARYFYDAEAIKVPALQPFGEARLTGSQAKTTAGGFTTNGTGNSTLGTNQGPSTANLRNFWLLGPEPTKEAHYAAFVTEIPKRAILAGTSAKGACPACGAPWVRISKPTTEYQATLEQGRSDPAWGTARRSEAVAIGNAFGSKKTCATAAYQTLGWQPGCTCTELRCPRGCVGPVETELACIQCESRLVPTVPEPVPQTVLDPFAGTGTTALVADRLGRDAIGIELSPAYAEMARRRIQKDAGPMFADVVS